MPDSPRSPFQSRTAHFPAVPARALVRPRMAKRNWPRRSSTSPKLKTCINRRHSHRHARRPGPAQGASPIPRGLLFTVALDRGGDIVDASFQQFRLAYLTPAGLLPPSHAYHSGTEWLHGGRRTRDHLVPHYMGGPRKPMGNTSLRTLLQPRRRSRRSAIPTRTAASTRWRSAGVRDARMFGPSLKCAARSSHPSLPEILLEDEVTSRGRHPPRPLALPRNLGYPLLDCGAR